jgi:hypothetical protein
MTYILGTYVNNLALSFSREAVVQLLFCVFEFFEQLR